MLEDFKLNIGASAVGNMRRRSRQKIQRKTTMMMIMMMIDEERKRSFPRRRVKRVNEDNDDGDDLSRLVYASNLRACEYSEQLSLRFTRPEL